MKPEHFTIIGGAGFIGSNLGLYLSGQGASWSAPKRSALSRLEGRLGHVVYCAGVTADFRERPFDTIDAHVSLLNKALKDWDFDSLTYLSSTRVYIHSDGTRESDPLKINPGNPEDIFNASKIAGECLCAGSSRDNVRAVRVSNVIGEDFGSRNFVFDLMHAASADKKITLRSSLSSEKDYIHIADVTAMLAAIARTGSAPIYNLGSGGNITNKDIVEQICLEIPSELDVVPGAPAIRFPPINVDAIVRDFGYSPTPVLPYVRYLAARFRSFHSGAN